MKHLVVYINYKLIKSLFTLSWLIVGNKLTDSVLDIWIFVRRRSSRMMYTKDIILRHTIVQSYNCMTIVNVWINSRDSPLGLTERPDDVIYDSLESQ